ncbi:MAG: 2-oxoglutarate dehydrogenase, E2 component, dihydrolipoamide succinyltransferase [Bryobacteraceae bacterium]|jgi:2-oxoglutarate dehydrogenase E2 component (dihydrolipoamide succinyltransferase)
MTDVVMPQMGESIVEGTLTKWLKKTGDKVERDEPLFEISTDKVDTEIPSPAAGTLGELLVQEGQTVQVNAIVARINEGGDGAGAPAAPAKSAAVAPPPPPPPAPVAKAPAPAPIAAPAPPPPTPAAAVAEVKEPAGPLSPLVRRIAREKNIDLTKVTGTGAGGRITKEDLDAYGKQAVAAPAAPAPVAPASAPAAPAVPIGQAQPTAKSRIEPMSNMRIKIAEHMVMSKRVSAHVTTVHRVDMTRVAKMRARHKEDFAARYGISLTFLPFVARAAVEALRTFPIVNASIDGTNIIYHNEINLGIAVALENGLIVPVIRNADEKNVLGLQRSIVDLASRARARQLKPDEIQGGTFSITNFGTFGSVFATPLINQPQVAILGVGTIEKVPVVIDDAIGIRSQCFLALTFDHRLIDGALGDQFTGKVKSVLENWSEDVL